MTNKKTLYYEFIEYTEEYRIFDPEYPEQTIAYYDYIEEAYNEHPEYLYKEV